MQAATDLQPSKISIPVAMTEIPGLHLVSMADFDAEMRAREAEENERRRLLSGQQRLTKKQKPQTPSLPGEPVLISNGRKSSEWVPKLMQLVQARRVVCNFTLHEPEPYSFAAELAILDKGIEMATFSTGENFFRNKKEAKDAVAEHGFNYLLAHAPPPLSTSNSTAKAASPSKPEENWLGLLNHFCQTASTPPPKFLEYQGATDVIFSATCSISMPGSNEIVFGDPTSYCTTKKAARAQAARDAVLYLRDKHLLPTEGLKSGIHTPADVSRKRTPLGELPASDNAQNDIDDPSYSPSSQVPVMQQILALCRTMRVVCPAFTYTPDPQCPAFMSAAAFFPGESDLQGPIGFVERVFGKKKAKEECAKRVLVVLGELRGRRLEEM